MAQRPSCSTDLQAGSCQHRKSCCDNFHARKRCCPNQNEAYISCTRAGVRNLYMNTTILLHRQRKHENSKSSFDCKECSDEISFIRHIKNNMQLEHKNIHRYGGSCFILLAGCFLTVDYERKSALPSSHWAWRNGGIPSISRS